MEIKNSKNPQTILSIKILLAVSFFFLLFLFVNLTYLRWAAYGDIKQTLKQTSNRISADLTYKDGKWNTASYVNDDQISQDNPLYIITTDGFIIDRETPINGFLDTSDFKFSSSFQMTQTIITPANEQWRIFSKPITKDGSTVGTIIVGYYQPEESGLKDIDNQLVHAANDIFSAIKINGNRIDVANVRSKNVSIKISYEVIDRFNNALKSIGGLPSYIDRSYLSDLLSEKYLTIVDKSTGESFLIYAAPIFNTKNPVGVVVNGYSLKQVNSDLRNQLIFSIATSIAVLFFLLLTVGYMLRKEIARLIKEANHTVQKVFYISQRSGAFGFDKDAGILYLYDRKMEIPVKTKQYYICKVLFLKPDKNWENDEIIDKLPKEILEVKGEDLYETSLDPNILKKKARMIYDAIHLLNKRAKQVFGYDAILVQGKTYRINPNVQPQNQ